MNKDFIDKKKQLQQQINLANSNMNSFLKEYVANNRKFSNGEKIRLICDKGISYVVYVFGADVHDDGEIFYALRKCKSDGSMSVQRFSRSKMENYTLEKINDFTFEDDLDNWKASFYCNDCGTDDITDFIYQRTVANGEVWSCKSCKEDIIFKNKPNEDNY